MQLSAPTLFPETLLPAAPGEIPADVAAEGEPPADFAALFAGLTAPAPKTPAVATPPATPKAKTPLDDAGLLAAFVAVPTAELPPAPPLPPDLPVGVVEGAEQSEVDVGEHALPGPQPLFESSTPRQSATTAAPPAPALANGRTGDASGLGERVPVRAPMVVSGAPLAPVAATPLTAVISTPPSSAPSAQPAAPAEPADGAAEAVRLAAAGPVMAEVARPAKSGLSRRVEGWGQEVAKSAAKFAADATRAPQLSTGVKTVEEKNFLNIDGEIIAKPDAGLGTGVALRESVMTTSAPTAPSPVFAPVGLGPKEGGIDLGAMGSLDAKVTVPEPIERMAHRAVEAVAAMIERGASQPTHSVNLKFSVQGADLMVRVALRSEEVQVTFRTDSSDLRTALAQEWQLVRSRDPDGVLHAVTPVFTAGDAGNSTSQGGREGGGSFAQQQAQAQADAQSQRQFSRPPAPAAPPSSGATAAHGASTAAVARPLSNEPSGAARLLHTFA